MKIIKSLELSDYSKLMEMYLDRGHERSKRHVILHANGLLKRMEVRNSELEM